MSEAHRLEIDATCSQLDSARFSVWGETSSKRQSRAGSKSMYSGTRSLGFNPSSATYWPCFPGQVTYHLCASVFLPLKWGQLILSI